MEQSGWLDEEPELINIEDIPRQKDDLVNENNFVGGLMDHFFFRLLTKSCVVMDIIIFALQMNASFSQEFAFSLFVCEHIIFTIFVWEILLKWCYGFMIFWRSLWNITNLLMTLALIVGRWITNDPNTFKMFRVVRMIGIIRCFTSMQGMIRTVQVLTKSIADMNMFFLLFLVFMLVYAVCGFYLFSTAVPSAYGSLFSACYTLFVCLTQDGWTAIFRMFEDDEELFGTFLFFAIFIFCGTLIFGFFDAIFIGNLHMSKPDQTEQQSPTDNAFSKDRPEDNAILEEVIKKITKCQKTLKSGYLENLTVETYEDLVIVISAIQRNLDECLEIRQEIEMIVEEVHKKKHDHVPTAYRKTLSLENQLKNELATGDILSTLINFEKAHILDTSTDSPHLDRGMIFHAAKQMETSSQADLTLSATGNSKSSVRSTEDK